MLIELGIRNLAIVAEAILPVGKGLTVITGETGAGKSLLLDALHLVLGGRGKADLIGPTDDATVIWASFEISDEQAQALNEERGIATDPSEPLVMRRRIQANGRSTAWINDQPVTLQTMRSVGQSLVDIRVQHEHLRLADRQYQLGLLDRYGKQEALAHEYRQAHADCLRLEREIEDLQSGAHDSQRELDFCHFQLQEIDALGPEAGEVQRLEEQQQLLAGAEEYRLAALSAADALEGGEAAAMVQVARLARRLADIPQENLQEAARLLTDAEAILGEAAAACRQADDAIRVDPETLLQVDERLAEYHRLLRKHGGDEAALLATWENLSQRVQELSSLDERSASLQNDLQQAQQQRLELGRKLRRGRKSAAKKLFGKVGPLLTDLNMPHATLSLADDGDEPGLDGLGEATVLVSTNPGMAAGPLGAIPSGGESARLTLALAAALAEVDRTPVMVFDEADNGVGGRLGIAIGQQLAALGQHRTVVAVTHTPQVAACADNHLVVRKQQSSTTTVVGVDALPVASRPEEIAAMLGGGEAALQQAHELIKQGGRS